MINIRRACLADLPRLTEIYNYAILNTTATFDLEPQTVEERKIWFGQHGERYPLIVAEEDGEVMGYCGILPYRSKPAYARTVEISVYVHPDAHGRGIGSRLMEEMICIARELGYHVIVAGITGGNEASFRLHRRFGFQCTGILREVGHKFGEWQDVHFYQLIL
jgi:L-amino acid N-acyltransferase YncA